SRGSEGRGTEATIGAVAVQNGVENPAVLGTRQRRFKHRWRDRLTAGGLYESNRHDGDTRFSPPTMRLDLIRRSRGNGKYAKSPLTNGNQRHDSGSSHRPDPEHALLVRRCSTDNPAVLNGKYIGPGSRQRLPVRRTQRP